MSTIDHGAREAARVRQEAPDVHRPGSEAEAIAWLRRLIHAGFVGAPVEDECDDGYRALVYWRWWSSGSVDVVTVAGEHDAFAYRASGVDRHRPSDLHHAVVWQRLYGPVATVVPAMLAWPTPRGALVIRFRPADPRTLAAAAEARPRT